ncbi:MAG: hypothetical protein V7776_23065 [Halopseudomonas aestusnigri]
MTDPIGAVPSISKVGQGFSTPPLIDNLDEFFQGISLYDQDPNVTLKRVNEQMDLSDKAKKLSMDATLLGPLGKSPRIQKLKQMEYEIQMDLSAVTRKSLQQKMAMGIASTKISVFTSAISKAMNGMNQLLQGS